MTLLEMLDVLEGGCHALQQKNAEMAAVLEQVRASAEISTVTNVNSAAAESPKQRRPAKRKSKPAKKQKKAAVKKQPAAAQPKPKPAEEAAPDGEAKSVRGKRQALGMSFSKLRAAIQARRAGQRQEQETESS